MTDLKYRMCVWKEKLQLGIVWVLPRWLIYWAAVRLISHATQGQYSDTVVPELTATDALTRWVK